MPTASIPGSSTVLAGRLLERIKRAFSQFLSIPLLVVLGFIALALAAHAADVRAGGVDHWGPVWSYFGRYVGDPSSATSLLSAIASGLITVTSITFSILLLAVQQGASALNSQIIDNYLRRRSNQLYFGCFVGVSIFTLVTLVLTTNSLRPVLGPVGIRNALSNGSLLPNNPVGGTGIYDALFSECSYAFANQKVGSGRDAIALFSDGEDTSSRMTLASAVQACRKNNVAVYAFSPKPLASLSPLAVSMLREISDETGGTLLALGDEGDADLKRLRELSSAMRSGYILFYKPGALKPDGSFHRVVLVGPTRVAVIRSAPGYYAPSPIKP